MTSFLRKLFGVPKIEAPVLGIVDLSRGAAAEMIETDRSALAPLFSRVVERADGPPSCDVLFLYCSFSADGSILGSVFGGLREVIRDSGAKVVVVATPNNPESYMAAGQQRRYGSANLVMTLDRKGDSFPRFFGELFSAMKRGVSMPVAWVQLAPQAPDAEHEGCPETIFACEIGQLTFG